METIKGAVDSAKKAMLGQEVRPDRTLCKLSAA